MARPTDEQMKTRLMEELRSRGGYSGNIRLLSALGWSEDEYWRVRNKLIDEGILVKGQGKGGTVRIVEEIEEPVQTTTDIVVERVVTTVVSPVAAVREETLYEPCVTTLQHYWFPERQITELHIEITAHQGRRNTGGTWTRPDISALSARTFRYVPGRHLDVWTFEVKPADQLDVVGVFEAAAHSRSATRSYCLFEIESARGEMTEAILRRAQDEARRFGLGLITFSDPRDYSTWETLVEAARRDPAPELLDEFIAKQISENGRDKLLRWTK